MSVFAIDAEYAKGGRPGRVTPVAFTLINAQTGAVRQYWQDELDQRPPSPHQPGDIVITYSAAAEASFYDAMGWARPDGVVDVWAEFMAFCNGPDRAPVEGFNLVGCLQHF